ncbi:bifunctional phosphopantothenoylcysteine decarboxylase/phosphopantothenate--cysteine ligase CoaBC [Spelaeicoccus albus]|uniref:Coenzyme A biosynthesis bifunctional protein CoaBC n=1 Tax=Spelaeicoccus albus TaxID=1280376 RepID=A0A7Z0IIK8_9MICO|nr:bifunctional phosphopantothenoylcysteine decarboxylase/phosphopantothenate--cysteine ligase CoaBC [Spelaeicoccus albus]NYI68600.1 phosphopantothenoylcysteine decarboxylase/phosphopantothenate--cysteine ligase [Spelaeicoccus albus]
MARIVLGVSGGIAAYKAAMLLRRFTESGHDVHVVPTRAALEFVGSATWEALSGHPVHTGVFENVADVPHVRLGRAADLVVVAPATADLLAKAAHGNAEDLLTATLLTATAPVVLAPAMHTEMWQHPATSENVATLRSRGAIVIDPDSGRLTGADTGPGRLPDPETIYQAALAALAPRDLDSVRVVVSAGGTREPLDPVRFLGNRSSGRQGLALARAAAERGATVRVVAAHLEDPAPSHLDVRAVSTAAELETAMAEESADADVVIMAAAVADYRPARIESNKLKKSGGSGMSIDLVQNPDILRGLVTARDAAGSRRLIVGFAAETGDDAHSVVEYGQAKLASKGCDLLVVNEVGAHKTFGTDTNAVTILGKDSGTLAVVTEQAKSQVAHAVLDVVAEQLHRSDPTSSKGRPQ